MLEKEASCGYLRANMPLGSGGPRGHAYTPSALPGKGAKLWGLGTAP